MENYIVEIFAMYGFDFVGVANTLVKNGIISSIWFAYLLKSLRVKETFVVAYENEREEENEFYKIV